MCVTGECGDVYLGTSLSHQSMWSEHILAMMMKEALWSIPLESYVDWLSALAPTRLNLPSAGSGLATMAIVDTWKRLDPLLLGATMRPWRRATLIA
jgi:hypothetical protein